MEVFSIKFYIISFLNCIIFKAYRTNEAKPWVLPVVKKAEMVISQDECLNHEYLGQLGMEKFTDLATKMLLGEDSIALKESRVNENTLLKKLNCNFDI